MKPMHVNFLILGVVIVGVVVGLNYVKKQKDKEKAAASGTTSAPATASASVAPGAGTV